MPEKIVFCSSKLSCFWAFQKEGEFYYWKCPISGDNYTLEWQGSTMANKKQMLPLGGKIPIYVLCT